MIEPWGGGYGIIAVVARSDYLPGKLTTSPDNEGQKREAWHGGRH